MEPHKPNISLKTRSFTVKLLANIHPHTDYRMSDGLLLTHPQLTLKTQLSPTHSPKEILGRASALVWKASLNWTQPIQVGPSLKSLTFSLKHAVSVLLSNAHAKTHPRTDHRMSDGLLLTHSQFILQNLAKSYSLPPKKFGQGFRRSPSFLVTH